jgi:hypothetical protein
MNIFQQTWGKQGTARANSIRSFWPLLHVCTALWFCCAGPLEPLLAQSTTVSREYPLKVAYLYNFGSYVEWPASAFPTPQSPFVVGVMGANPFGTLLDEVASTKKIQGRPIVIRYLTSAAEATACQLVFIAEGASYAERLATIKATRPFPILTVSESPGMAAQGAIVNFFVEHNKIRFEINVKAAREHELTISSKLLSLSRVIGADSSK